MNYYSIPSDFKVESVERYIKLNQRCEDKITEVYGQLNSTENIFGSGRTSNQLPEVTYNELKNYISLLSRNGFSFNYTFNASCLSNMEFTKDGQQKIITFLNRLIDAGVNSVTVCMPSLIELIHELNLPIRIKSSTVCGVTNGEKARAYRSLGVSRLVADESINRDFTALRQMVQVFPDDLELIVNVICDKNCIYRPFHHNQMSHDCKYLEKSTSYYSHRCSMHRAQTPENILKMNFIRPEDIIHYENVGIHHYKVQGRQAAEKGDILRTVEAYMMKSYEGDLLELLDCFLPTNSFRVKIDNKRLDGFLLPFLQDNFCQRDCKNCNYCLSFFKKFLPYDEIDHINQIANEFYKGTDEFSRDIMEWSNKINGK